MSLCKLTEMWGKRSALVSEDCAFAQMKRALQQRLQEEKIFIQDDAQNRTPHVALDGDPAIYEAINNADIRVDLKHLTLHTNFISIMLPRGKHFTLVFTRNLLIAEQAPLVLRVLAAVLNDVLKPEHPFTAEQLLEHRKATSRVRH